MVSYRFSDKVNRVPIDYIIFIYTDQILISTKAKFEFRSIETDFAFFIKNKIIDWADVNSSVISIKCQAYCQKLISLGVFA